MEDWVEGTVNDTCHVEYGTRITRKNDSGTLYPVYGGGGETFRTDSYNREDRMVIARFGISERCTRLVAGKFFLNDSGLTLSPREPNIFLPRFLNYLILGLNDAIYALGRGTAQKNLDVDALRLLRFRYPASHTLQRRIVAILDEAFAAIATATANAEKNLANAEELYRSLLRACFDQTAPAPPLATALESPATTRFPGRSERISATESRTRGRQATEKLIQGDLSLSVGMPTISPRPNWRWSKLTSLAQLESGHTPSRRHPEYWGGDVPWIGIRDAKANHGSQIEETEMCTNHLGLANSAARLLPAGTVCLSRTASVGYVVVLGRDMATSQDFVNWICSTKLEPEYLKYLFIAEGKDLLRYASGSVHQTIYFPEVKAFHVCHPDPHGQLQIVEFLDKATGLIRNQESIAAAKTLLLNDLKQSLLRKAFTGELTAESKAADRSLSEAGV